MIWQQRAHRLEVVGRAEVGEAAALARLGKDRRLYGALILEQTNNEIGSLLSDRFLQWHAVAEFHDWPDRSVPCQRRI